MIVIAIALALSLSLTAMLAWDYGRRVIEERAATRISENQLAENERRLSEHDRLIKVLAEDWLRKFDSLENDWKKFRDHADTQYAGAIAQAESVQHARGYHR